MLDDFPAFFVAAISRLSALTKSALTRVIDMASHFTLIERFQLANAELDGVKAQIERLKAKMELQRSWRVKAELLAMIASLEHTLPRLSENVDRLYDGCAALEGADSDAFWHRYGDARRQSSWQASRNAWMARQQSA